jgi:type I restriction enzyme S subunit
MVFLLMFLQSPATQKQLEGEMEGGTQKFIALNKIRSLLVNAPGINEQHCVSQLMTLVDRLITLHQRARIN